MRRALLHVFALLCAIALASAAQNGEKKIRTRVAFIGGGPAGLSGCAFLKMYYNIPCVVLEKDEIYGGNCNTEDTPYGTKVDIGTSGFQDTKWLFDNGGAVQQFWNETDTGVFDSFHLANLFSNGSAVHSSGGGGSRSFAANWNTGEVLSVPSPSPAFAAALGRLWTVVNKYPWFDNATRPSPMPAELLRPFSDIIVEYDLFPLVPTLFAGVVTGFTDYNDTLALYALIQLKPALLYLLQGGGGGFGINGGCMKMYDGMVNNYIGQNNVITSANVYKVKRPSIFSNDPVEIKVRVGSGNRKKNLKVEADIIVLAHPLNLQTMGYLDPDFFERRAFSEVHFRYWATLLLNLSGPIVANASNGAFSLYNWDLSQPFYFHPPPCVQSIRRFIGEIGTSKIVSKYDMTTEEAIQVWEDSIANIPDQYLTDANILVLDAHNQYVPYVPKEALELHPNPYQYMRDLNAELHRHTYYHGTTTGDNDTMLQWFISRQLSQRLRDWLQSRGKLGPC